MNKVKIIVICFMFTAIVDGGMAQSVEEEEMDQDIEVIESILDQLFFQNYKKLSRSKRVSGNYLPGFGLIFKIPRYENFFLGSHVSDDIYAVMADEHSNLVMGQNVFMKDKMDSIREAGNTYFYKTIKSFFIDYGDLIGQLEANDNVLVIFGSAADNQSNNYINNPFILKRLKDEGVEKIRPSSKIVAQISYNDILNYKRGKISENQFTKNIRFSEKSLNENVDQEFVILTRILEKVYGSHAGSFGRDRSISFERIDGLGVIYEMSLGRALSSGRVEVLPSSGVLLPSVTPDKGDNENEKNGESTKEASDNYNRVMYEFKKQQDTFKKQQNEAYREFKKELKLNLIKYGKTLKSLKNEEILMLATKLPNCFDCDKPEKLNLIVKASVLKDYSQRKITMDQAVEQIMEKEVRSSNRW